MLYMHVFGQGDPVKLATALHAGLALSKTPMGPPASGGMQPQAAQQIGFDTAAVDKIMGYKGKEERDPFGTPHALNCRIELSDDAFSPSASAMSSRPIALNQTESQCGFIVTLIRSSVHHRSGYSRSAAAVDLFIRDGARGPHRRVTPAPAGRGQPASCATLASQS